MPRVFFWVQHLLGIGHLRRAATLARGLAQRGFDVLLVSGGAPVPGLDLGQARLHLLPPLRARDESLRELSRPDGTPPDEAFYAARTAELLGLLRTEAPDIVITELRPYRSRGTIGSWMRDETVPAYLEERLKKYRYTGIGEFHLFGDDADLPVPRRMVELARQHNLYLHAHSDADAVERLFRQWPQARILWAHSGFAQPEDIAAMLARHPNLWCDLAFRADHAPGGRLDPAWRKLFLAYPDRFMVGTDTFTPERWYYVEEHARWSRGWLAELPHEVAEQIAWKNGERLFAPK